MRKTIDAEILLGELEILIQVYQTRAERLNDPARLAGSIATVHTIMNMVNKLRGAK